MSHRTFCSLRSRCCPPRPARRRPRPLLELLERREMFATDLLSQTPWGPVGEAVRAIDLQFSAPLDAESARHQANFRLTSLGADGALGGGDDGVLPVLPQYVAGASMLRLSTLADLSAWTSVDYGFPRGILGDWRLDTTTGSVVQAAEGGAAMFVGDVDLIDRDLVAQFEVETSVDDDFVGTVFGLRTDPDTGLPDDYYLLGWKKTASAGAPGGLRLVRVAGAGDGAARPDLWRLADSDPFVTVLAARPEASWQSGVRYEFRVRQESSGAIQADVLNAETGATVWTTRVVDPEPLGRGRAGFYNFSQPRVRYWSLRSAGSLPAGAYRLEVFSGPQALRDADGNPVDGDANGIAGGNYAAHFTVEIGVATLGVDLLPESDTGASASDNLTRDATPTFALAVNRPGAVELFLDGAIDPVATLPFAAAGIQTWTAPTLGDGRHALRALFTPTVGNPTSSTLAVEIDTAGPYLLAGTAQQQAPLATRTLRFSEPLADPAATPGAAFSLFPPGGATLPLAAPTVAGAELTFAFPPQTAAGLYQIVGSAALTDRAGNRVDQNRNGAGGEAEVDLPRDAFTLLADAAPPQVTSFAPQGVVRRTVQSLRAVFNEQMLPATFGPGDVALAGPVGAPLPAVAEIRAVNAAHREFEIVLAAPLAVDGAYSVTIGPDVRDLSGNPLAAPFTSQFQIALPLPLPAVPGEGVFIELFNGVGGGAAPTPASLANLTPDGTTLSPRIDFPSPGSVINVGQSFNNFFASTATPPATVLGLAAANFTLRHTFYLGISAAMDLNPATPAIDVRLGVGSDDGFRLTVDDRFLGSAGDRGFGYSWFDFAVESAGLFPVELLYAANAVGQSGLEFSWQTALSGASQIVPQQFLYVTPVLGDRTITFEELPVGAAVDAQYRDQGVVFRTLGGNPRVTDVRPSEFVPVSRTRVLADPSPAPAAVGEVELAFVVPGTNDAATTNFVSLYVIDAEQVGATVTAYDPEGNVLAVQEIRDPAGGGAQRQVTIQRDRIARVAVTLGQGADTAAIDNVTFNTPVPLNARPVLAAIPDAAIDEHATLAFTVVARDDDGPGQTLTYSLGPGAPAGAAIHPATGAFRWTPSETQGGGAYPITVVVRDSGTPRLRDEATFAVVVAETNSPPALPPLADRVLTAGEPLQFFVGGSDPDLPAQTLAYSLDAGAPVWVAIDAPTGRLTANVPPGVADGLYPVTVRLTDDGPGRLSASGAFTLRVDNDRPDLAAQNIAAAGPFVPGAPFTLTWQVVNRGREATVGQCVERVYLARDASGAERQLLASFSRDCALAPGAALTRTERINLPQTSFNGPVYLLVELDAADAVAESDERNLFAGAAPVTIPAALGLSLSPASATEGGGALEGTLVRNGDAATPLEVTLAASVPGQLAFPGTVTIPAGQYVQRFSVSAVDDSAVETTQAVLLQASAAGFQGAAAAVTVEDDDRAVLTVTLDVGQLAEGAALRGRVTRSVPATEPVLISLASSAENQLQLPPAVALPTGQTAVEFEVAAIDDALIERSATYVITASALRHDAGTALLTVPQNDVPALSLALPAALVEGARGPTVVGILTRDAVSSAALTVELAASDAAWISVPASVTIPANALSATFPIVVADDALAQGDRRVTITAQVRPAAGGAPLAEGAANAAAEVLDNDGPALSLEVARETLAEGAATVATVRRNTVDLSQPLTVVLSSNDPTEAGLPSSVVIPSGARFAEFAVAGVADGLSDGDRLVTLLAQAGGWATGAASILVVDRDLPDLAVTEVTAPAAGLTGGSLPVGWTVANRGYAAAQGIWTERVYFSRDDQVGDDVLASQTTRVGPLAVDGLYRQTATLTLPSVPGDYWLVVETDVAGAVSEGLKTNNARLSAAPIRVAPAFTAVVAADVDRAPADTPVRLAGAATRPDGSPAAFAQVSVHVGVRGTRRVLTAIADAAGNFATTFRPLPGEGGTYAVAAAHPGESDPPMQDSFQLIGMRAEPPEAALALREGGPAVGGSVTLRNLSDVPLTGLTVEVLDAPEGLQVTAALANARTAVGAYETLTLAYSAAALDAQTLKGTLRLHVRSVEAPTVVVPVRFEVNPLLPQLVAEPRALTASMLVGDQTIVELRVTNTGGRATGPLEILLPEGADWLSVASPARSPSLDPGGTLPITLLLTPPADLALTEYVGSLVVRSDDAQLTAPFAFRAVAEETGDLEVTVVDEYFYFTAEKPLVVGATVTLRDVFTGEKIVSSADARPPAADGGELAAATAPPSVTIGPDGRVRFTGVARGPYTLEVASPDHETYRNTVRVDAGALNDRQVFISRNLVSYIWTVEEVEIEDRTRIVVDAVFETNVPAPVVTVEGVIDLYDLTEIGQSQQFDIKVTNHGLIEATDVAFNFGTHPFYEIKPLIEQIGVLPARSEITVPVIITRIADFKTPQEQAAAFLGTGLETLAMLSASAAAAALPAQASTGVPCGISACVVWAYVCQVPIVRCSVVPISGVEGNCPTRPFNPTPSPGGGVVFGGQGGVSSPSLVSIVNCNECIEKLAEAALKCVIKFLPLDDWEKCALGTYNCYDASSGGYTTYEGLKCAKTAWTCVRAIAKSAGKNIPGTPGWLKYIECFYELLTACLEFKDGGAGAASTDEGGEDSRPVKASLSLRSSIAGRLRQLEQYTEFLKSQLDVLTYAFGDNSFLEADSYEQLADWMTALESATTGEADSSMRITPAAANKLIHSPARPATLSDSQIHAFVERWNRTVDYYDEGIFNLSDVPAGGSTNFIAIDQHQRLVEETFANAETLANAGYQNAGEAMEAMRVGILSDLATYSSDGVCAEVKIQIEQQTVQTRSAFEAKLGIKNQTAESLENIAVDVVVLNSEGEDVTHLFGVQFISQWNLRAVDGTGVLEPNSAGEGKWIIIAASEAAANGPTEYFVAGAFRYDEAGVTVERTLLPTSITVYPQAELDLDYFLQRDVVSDDPFTEVVESAEPFTLAVMVQNNGGGAARKLRIESAQPRIVENEKGLLIDFEITGTKVNGGDVQPSLTAQLGDVAPGARAIAEWQMEASLQGLFTEYDVSFQHESPFGDNRFSLIKSAQIHELIRVVNAAAVDGGDGLSDFLVNDTPDPLDLPDALYLSDGSVAAVGLGARAAVGAAPTLDNLRVTLTADMTAGWSYLKMNDPSLGVLRLIGVERSDGTPLPAENFWQTDRTFIGLGQRPRLEDKIHLLDHDSTGSYTLIFSNGDRLGPAVVGFAGVVPNPTTQAIDVVDVTFSEPLAGGAFASEDLTLARNGAPVPLAGIAIAKVGDATYRISGLAASTAADAVYELAIDLGGVVDRVGNAGAGLAAYRWVKGETAPTVLELAGAPGGLVTEGPASIDVVFSKPVAGLDAADLTLARDGGANLIDAQATIAQVGERTYRIGNLGRLTGVDGAYVFAIDAGGVQDGGGNAGVGAATARWTRDATPPVLLDVVDPATNPRNIVVQQIDVAFSEPIDMASLDGSDLRLVRDGGSANLLAGDGRVTFESRGGNVYRIGGINWAQAFAATPQVARFTLTVDAAGVTDQAGNPGVGLLGSTWTIDLDKPAAPTNLVLATASGPASGGRLNSRRATLSGVLSEAGLTVVVRDVTTGRELAREKIDGAAFALPIEFPSAGRHALQVRVVDPAGNVADAALDDLFVNEARPTVKRLGRVPAGPTSSAVDAVDVEFVEPIDAASLSGAALSLFRDGGPNLLAVPPTVALLSDGRTFRFTGLGASTAVDGQYQLQVDLRGVRSALGVAADEVLVEGWLRDAASPTARVTSLPATTPTANFLVQWSGDDGPRGAGIAAFDVFVAIDGGNFAPWTVGTSEREGVFTGSPGVRYAFYAVAVDRAGNRQPAPAAAQTQTLVAAAVNGPPIGLRLSSDVVKPRSPLGAAVGVLSAVDPNANDLFAYALVPGPGSGDNAAFAIDGAQVRTAAPLAAAPRDYAIRVRATDSGGLSYEQSFVIEAANSADFNGDNAFTGRDLLAWQRSFGTPQAATGDGDADGDRDVDADDLAAWATEFSRPPVPAVVAFDAQHGPRQRSFVRYVDLQWNAGVSSAELASLAASVDDADAGNDRIRLRRFGLNGARESVVNLQGRVRAVDRALTLDFGPAGLGGDPSGTAGDGYYELGVDRDGDGDLETRFAFFRLLGDASGDGFVDGADLAIITEALGEFGGNVDADVNGDGRVDGLDEAAWQRGQGRALAPGLRP